MLKFQEIHSKTVPLLFSDAQPSISRSDSVRSPWRTPSGVYSKSYLLVRCVWRLLFNQKKSFWNAPLPKFGVFLLTVLQPLFHTSPISRWGYNLKRSILKLNGWWPNVFLGKKCSLVKSSERLLKIVSELLCENWFDLVTNFVNNWWQKLRTTRLLLVRVLNLF